MLTVYANSGLYSGKPFPLIGNLEITKKCQLNCKICYNERNDFKKEMTTDDIIQIIDQLRERGCMYINITGGEPLLHSSFLEIYEHIALSGIRPSVESNGIILNDDIISMLKKYPPDKYHISLFSLDNHTYLETTGRLVSAQQVQNNILKLENSGINVIVRSPVSKYNYKKIYEVADWCHFNNIKFRCSAKIFWKQNGDRCIEHRCSKEDFSELRHSHKLYDYLYKDLERLENCEVKKCDCVSGILEFNIDAYGEMSQCIMFWNQRCNVLKYGLDYVWDTWIKNYRRVDDDFCLGKIVFDTKDECPWNKVLVDSDIDMHTPISVLFKDKIFSMSSVERDSILGDNNISGAQLEYILKDAERLAAEV